MTKWVSYIDKAKHGVWIVPVCNPDGVVKYVRVTPQINSGIVDASFTKDEMSPRMMNVRLRGGLEEKGWAFMADLFRDDNAMTAWDTFRNWIANGPMCKEGATAKPWPDKYLPSGVIDRRNGAATHQSEPDEIVIPEMEARASTSRKAREKAGL